MDAVESETNAEALSTGRQSPPAPRRPLRAGELGLELDGPDLRRIAYRGIEVAQQVYVAIRDVGWGTLPGIVEDLRIDEGPGPCFEVDVLSRHAYPAQGVDLVWRGAIEGSLEGVISYRLEVTARAPVEYNRLGLNILHGARTYAGRPFRARLGGLTTEGRLPLGVGPQAWMGHRLRGLLDPFHHLELSPLDGVVVRLDFEGDEFETEDQRNFGDGTFKTYSTPLQRPSPFRLEPGQSLRQAVHIRVLDERPSTVSVAQAAGPVTLILGGATGRSLPSFGLGQASDDVPLSATERQRVAALRPDHLRVELVAADGLGAARARLEVAAAEARALGCDLWVDLTIGAGDRRHLRDIVSAAIAADPRPGYLFLATPEVEPPSEGVSAQMLGETREIVRQASGATLVGAGAVMFFAELNRAPFDGATVESLTFPLSPTVHRADDGTVLENVDHLGDAVLTARESLGQRPLLVGPVSLATRHGPYPNGPTGEGDPPARVDPRQVSLLAAAWTVGCLSELALAGVEGLTLYETAGPMGVTERDVGTSMPGWFLSRPGHVFPLWHVLADAAEWRGAQLLRVDVAPAPVFTPDLAALALTSPDGLRILVASLVRETRDVVVAGLPGGSARVRRLDSENGRAATRDPVAFRGRAESAVVRDGQLALTLGPHAVVRVDLA